MFIEMEMTTCSKYGSERKLRNEIKLFLLSDMQDIFSYNDNVS